MSGPWKAWATFVMAGSVLIGAMTMLTVIGIRLDNSQQAAESRAELEQRVRLALWRMDAAVGPIVAVENARPYFEYAPFYSAERAYTNMFAPLDSGDVLVPSPLLMFDSPYIRIHFQYAPDGTLSSPNVPESNMRDLAETGFVTHEEIEAARKEIAKLQQFSSRRDIQYLLAKNDPQLVLKVAEGDRVAVVESNEYEQRAKSVQQSITNQALTKNTLARNAIEERPRANDGSTLTKPFWFGDELFLARAATVDDEVYLQGSWLDWPTLRSELILSIADLIPNAALLPETASDVPESTRRLAAAPIRLEIAPVAFSRAGLSPLRVALVVAWACVVAVVLAIGGLLWGTMALSERRATFVSAVTHELRTPLTTFQLYTDLLAENRVPDEAKRQSYFETLRNEASRLRHLVDNVLAYARLERSPVQQPATTILLGHLVDRIRPGIESQCTRSGMLLDWDDAGELDLNVSTNVEIVEQIVTNLVDNACKYGANADGGRITITCRHDLDELVLSVRDYGPGLDRQAARKLFRPFAKSANEAAASAPGVGLGLALSKRLARSLGGDLRWRGDVSPGCCFELSLPAR